MATLTLEDGAQGDIAELRQAYLAAQSAPVDGMWLSFASMARVLLVLDGAERIGFATINQDGKLLEFYLCDETRRRDAFDLLRPHVTGAMVPTTAPWFLSLCLDHHSSVEVNALLYRASAAAYGQAVDLPAETEFRPVTADELEVAVDFGEVAIGADRGWLTGYYQERIRGDELIGLWRGGALIAAGELRPSTLQPAYADVGMVVGQAHRGRGLATNILKLLIRRCGDMNLRAICSTEVSNPAAQKAITRAGFVAEHRLVDVVFGPNPA